MDFTHVKRIFNTWLCGMGFRRKGSKALWILDRGFYLIIAEAAPLRSICFSLEVGVHFLWSGSGDIVYSYSNGDTRIGGKPIFYDSPDFENEISLLKSKAEKAINEYLELSDFKTLKEKLESRRDFVVIANKGFENRDTDKASAKALSGEFEGACVLFENALSFYYTERINSLLQACDAEHFVPALEHIINTSREKFKLAPFRF